MSSLSRFLSRTFSTAAAEPAKTRIVKSIPDSILEEPNLKKVVELFKKSSESGRFRKNIWVYRSTVRRLAAVKRFRCIEEILEEQKKYRDITNEGFAVRLISLYGESGMFDQASKVFDELPELKCDRTVQSFNALLSACVKSKKFDKVEDFFRDLPKKLDVNPNVVSYNLVIKAFCEMGSLDAAVSTFDEMENKGLEPNLATFNTLLLAFYNNNRLAEADKFWARMENNKNNIVPDTMSYNAKLVGLVSEKKLSEAAELVDGLKAKELKPNAFTYNALIKSYCEDGNLEEVKRWYGEFGKNGCDPIEATFATIIPFACEKGEFSWAFELCKECFGKRCQLDAAVLQLVVDGLVKESKTREAKRLVQLGLSNRCSRKDLKMPSSEPTQETSTGTE